jgi:hypothetical protein
MRRISKHTGIFLHVTWNHEHVLIYTAGVTAATSCNVYLWMRIGDSPAHMLSTSSKSPKQPAAVIAICAGPREKSLPCQMVWGCASGQVNPCRFHKRLVMPNNHVYSCSRAMTLLFKLNLYVYIHVCVCRGCETTRRQRVDSLKPCHATYLQ